MRGMETTKLFCPICEQFAAVLIRGKLHCAACGYIVS